MKNTIITIKYNNYEENVIVNKSNYSEVKQLVKDNEWSIFFQGDFIFNPHPKKNKVNSSFKKYAKALEFRLECEENLEDEDLLLSEYRYAEKSLKNAEAKEQKALIEIECLLSKMNVKKEEDFILFLDEESLQAFYDMCCDLQDIFELN